MWINLDANHAGSAYVGSRGHLDAKCEEIRLCSIHPHLSGSPQRSTQCLHVYHGLPIQVVSMNQRIGGLDALPPIPKLFAVSPPVASKDKSFGPHPACPPEHQRRRALPVSMDEIDYREVITAFLENDNPAFHDYSDWRLQHRSVDSPPRRENGSPRFGGLHLLGEQVETPPLTPTSKVCHINPCNRC